MSVTDNDLTNRPAVETRAGVVADPLPPEMALACEKAGVAKAGRDTVGLVVLGILAGAFIALGAVFMTVVMTGAEGMPWGSARLLAGVVFSLGLILVIVGGAELFTGDALMVVAFASQRIRSAPFWRMVARLRRQYHRSHRNGCPCVPCRSLSIRCRCGRQDRACDRFGQGGFADRSALLSCGAVQRARMPRRVDGLGRSKRARQSDGHRASCRGLCCGRVRALNRQPLPPPLRPRHQGVGRDPNFGPPLERPLRTTLTSRSPARCTTLPSQPSGTWSVAA